MAHAVEIARAPKGKSAICPTCHERTTIMVVVWVNGRVDKMMCFSCACRKGIVK